MINISLKPGGRTGNTFLSEIKTLDVEHYKLGIAAKEEEKEAKATLDEAKKKYERVAKAELDATLLEQEAEKAWTDGMYDFNANESGELWNEREKAEEFARHARELKSEAAHEVEEAKTRCEKVMRHIRDVNFSQA